MTPAQKLVEAEAAFHALVTGTAVVEVTDQNGEKIKYNAANQARLSAYIQDLQSQIFPTVRGSSPMRFWGS